LEGHEQPYLRGGTDDVIRTGHTFSDEPGVYIEGKVRVVLAIKHPRVSPVAIYPLGWRAARRLFLYCRRWDWGVPDTECGRTDQITVAALIERKIKQYIKIQFGKATMERCTVYKGAIWIFVLDT
jgi:hypothetical protein